MARKRRKRATGFLERMFFGTPKRVPVKATTTKSKAKARKLDEEVVNAIWGVIFLTAGVLLIFNFFDALGILSQVINSALEPVLGWGVYVLPVLLVLVGLFVLVSKKMHLNIVKITGVCLFFISILSILHLSVPIEQIGVIAKEGTHGGLIGFATNFLLREKLEISDNASAVIFVAMFLIAALLTFENIVTNVFNLAFNGLGTAGKTAAKATGVVERDKPIANPVKDDSIRIIKPQFIEAETVEERPDRANAMPVPIEIEDELQTRIPIAEVEIAESQEAEVLSAEVIEWEYPPLSLLLDKSSEIFANDKSLRTNAEKIRLKLEQFSIKVVMKDVHVGPTVIQYTLKPSEGVKLSKITSLKNDLALTLAAHSMRIEAPIPGKSLVGIEVPSENRSIVYLREILVSPQFDKLTKKSKLLCPLGRDVAGLPIIADITDMPHLLIAGATGAGKSVGMNTILISLLYQNSPSDLKLILIDPKRVELTDYNGIPHLLTPVVTDPDKAANALNWAVAEMNRRYNTLAQARCRSIDEYNSDENQTQKMPKILIVIDELADLMLSNGKEVEASICRIAQMARAVGIHLIVATQRPSVDVITGLIKANIPTRISYAVASSIDSRTILDAIGAEDLLGRGDMLYLPKDLGKPIRVQGIYIDPNEIKRVTERLKLTLEPDYLGDIIDSKNKPNIPGFAGVSGDEADDDLYEEALRVIIDNNKASASLLQRRLKIGYARAARLLDLLEDKGVIGPVNGAKPREILINRS